MLDDYATWQGRRPQATQQEIADEMGVTRSALRRALDRDRARARDETTAPLGQEEKTMATYKDDLEAQVAGALMNTPAWVEATPEEREAARERWLGSEVDNAVDTVRTHCDDQWRAPGTAGHDETWAVWEPEDDQHDRSGARER